MPRQSTLLPREGITLDLLLHIFRDYIINPVLLLPILALTSTSPLAIEGLADSAWVKIIYYLLCLGVVQRFNAYLSRQALNNWLADNTWDWNKEIIVVTGGSQGIGEEIVKLLSSELLERGARGKVVVLDVCELSYDACSNVTYIKCDITSTAEISAAAAQIRATVGHPTVIINNAGVCRGKSILDATEKDLKLVFSVNTLSHFFMAKEFLPHIVQMNHGHIVTVASVGGYVQAPKMVDYNSSKAAALSFHEGLSMELVHTYKAPKVRTTIVTQGYVKTPLFEGYNNESKILLPALYPETVAEAIVDQVLSGKGGHIILPRAYYLLTGMRGWCSWLHRITLGTVLHVMDNFKGRQVIDPNK